MIQCKDCEFFHRDEQGRIRFTCDPFSTIKEPECLSKWQLIKADQLVQAYQATLAYYQKFAPLQEKMFKFVQREMNDIDETEKWKLADDEDETGDSSDEPRDNWPVP